MVSTVSTLDFSSIIDGLLAQKNIGGPHRERLVHTVRTRALALLAHPDMRYMPTFKVLDLMSALVNIASAIGAATQLRASEVEALLRESMNDGTSLIRQFMLEAALERARYEPIMLPSTSPDEASLRATVLNRRWQAMRRAHREINPLPESWLAMVDEAVIRVIMAEDFRNFRHGPLLQLFSEMLSMARSLHAQNAEREALQTALASNGVLWRRFSLKAKRFAQKPSHRPEPLLTYPPSHVIH